EVSPRTVHLRYVYRTVKDHLDASRVAEHLELIEKIRNVLSQRVSRGRGSSEPEEVTDAAVAIFVGTVAAPFIIIAVVLGARRGRRIGRLRRHRRHLRVAEGEGPENPVVIASEEGVEQMLKSLRCRCGAAHRLEEVPPSQQRLVYDGRRLIAVTLTCSICRAPRDVYFAPSDLS